MATDKISQKKLDETRYGADDGREMEKLREEIELLKTTLAGAHGTLSWVVTRVAASGGSRGAVVRARDEIGKVLGCDEDDRCDEPCCERPECLNGGTCGEREG